MTYYGEVRAGKPARLVIRHDCEITGHVFSELSTLRPIDVSVELVDTADAHLLGYSGTVVMSTSVDASGQYLFKNLPPCTFTLRLAGKRTSELLHCCYEERLDGGSWDYVWKYHSDTSYGSYGGPWVVLKRPIAHCDFRLTDPSSKPINGEPL
jgi:hypothetical protein